MKGRKRIKARVTRTDGGIEGRGLITDNMTARLSYRGRILRIWPLVVVADDNPEIALTQMPESPEPNSRRNASRPSRTRTPTSCGH